MPELSIQQACDLALQHHQAGGLAEAEAIYRQILAQQPDCDRALHLLGIISSEKGQNELAVELINRAISLVPQKAIYHNNLGLVLSRIGRFDEAIGAYRGALEYRSDYLDAWFNLGAALQAKRRLPEAIDAYKAAIKYRPDCASAYNNLGMIQKSLGLVDAAIASFQTAIHLRPDMAEAHNNLGNVYKDHVGLEEAMKEYQTAVRLKPDLVEAHSNIGNIFRDQAQIHQAVGIYRAALEINPTYAAIASNLVYTLYFHPDVDIAKIIEAQKLWNERFAQPLKKFIKPHANDRSSERKLRIGYLSSDFRRHVVGSNFLPLLRQHDREVVEIFCYSQVTSPDEITEQIRTLADHWKSIVGINDRKAADMIFEDRIDILVDLTLHMAGSRLLVFAYKPAPVQVTYLGYPGSTGVETIDYRLSDPYLDPTGTNLSIYSEQTVRLPETYWCYQPCGPAPTPSQPPVLSAGFITFGCLNNFAKVSTAVLDLWMQVLSNVPRSKLILHAKPGTHRDAIMRLLIEKGIDAQRLEFINEQTWPDYIKTYDRIDIALDPFPYNGGITTCDSLYMGAPVVSLSGRTAVGRAGKSILTNVGLPELIANTPREYVEIAVKLAGDLPKLTELRKTLRQRMENSPLMDDKRFARNIESVYRDIWRKWCGGPV